MYLILIKEYGLNLCFLEARSNDALQFELQRILHDGLVNTLDASAPLKRGKEREVPKAKKPSPLKKV